jgi:glyoxylase-like metal-dependent hydrolase (beta-lactamase superfamily II)
MTRMAGTWTEIADRVVVGRYRFLDQDIVAVLGHDAALVVDTRTTPRQARELLDDLRDLGSPRVGIVVNTHGHYDHAFGNAVFRPAVIWGHDRCATMIRETGDRQRTETAAATPGLANDLAEVVLDPPDRTFAREAVIDLDGRPIELAYLGRGHTDNDIVIRIPDADVVCAGDLLENGAPPYFGDGFPLDWPATVETLAGLVGPGTMVVPGHGDPGGQAFVADSLAALEAIVALGRRVHAGELTLEDAMEVAPYPAAAAREPLARTLAQLRGELDDR